jgi:hypothetical protein
LKGTTSAVLMPVEDCGEMGQKELHMTPASAVTAILLSNGCSQYAPIQNTVNTDPHFSEVQFLGK